jgi:mRNA interferase YafQ
MYRLVFSSHFDRQSERFKRRHPELRSRLARTIRDLQTDPFQPHLRLHALRGELEGLHALSLTHAYRILLTLRISEHEITLLDIGSHDDLYR